jgi:hypothetical protein
MLRDEQIRLLCDELLKASTDEEVSQLALLLKAALHEHVETIRGDLLVSIAPEIADDAEDPDKAA